MHPEFGFLIALLLSVVPIEPSAASSGGARTCAGDTGWNTPTHPFRIHGNTWYVGTCGISVLLITSQQGHVLIDGGTAGAAKQVLANINELGFDVKDVKKLLFSHEHFDHVGGLAELQRATGAAVLSRGPALETMRTGESDRRDPQFLQLPAFVSPESVETINDDARVTIGDTALHAIATPGHSPGSTSWTWRSCEGDQCAQIVYADSLTAISDDEYRYSDDPRGVQQFRATLDRVAHLDCDVLLTPHPQASAMWSRFGDEADESVMDRTACARYTDRARDSRNGSPQNAKSEKKAPQFLAGLLTAFR